MQTRVTRTTATILTVSIVLSLLLVLNYSAAQWTPAPADPPQNNVAAPINVGPQNQRKQGDIALQQGRIGANQFVTYDRVRSNLYCSLNGTNCFSAADVPTGGGGGNSEGLMKAMYDTSVPSGLSNWPDWVFCGKPYYIEGSRQYKDTQVSGAAVINFNSAGQNTNTNAPASCSSVQRLCDDGRCGFYDGSAPSVSSVPPALPAPAPAPAPSGPTDDNRG